MKFPVSILVPILPNPPTVPVFSTSAIFYTYTPIPISLSFYFLPHIGHIIIDTSDGLVPGISLFIPCLSCRPLGLAGLTYERRVPIPGAAPLPLG